MIAPATGLSAAAVAVIVALTAGKADGHWGAFRKRYVTLEGRVVDTGNGGISHSEGQGWGMLLAAHHRDRKTFDLLWSWTERNLQTRTDRLFAWKWVPNSATAVPDQNNATDGDLLIAWALLRAGRRWDVPQYTAHAQAIARDVLAKLVRKVRGETVLLPGMWGFEKDKGVVVNLSYWVYPALLELSSVVESPEWRALEQSGIRLLGSARFGRWQLSPDWLLLGENAEPAPGFQPRFGFDAVRIPLYLLWARKETRDLLRPFASYWKYFRGARFLPAWTDLTDDSIDSHNAPPGIRAIASLTTRYPKVRSARVTGFADEQDYYSYALLLLSEMMLEERSRR